MRKTSQSIRQKIHKVYLLLSAVIIATGVVYGLTANGHFEYLSLRYFTYLSNIFVIIGFIILFIFYNTKPRLRRYLCSSILLAISVTGLIYNFVLVPLDPENNLIFYSSYQNFSNHVLSMLLTLINYIVFEKKGNLSYKHVLSGMVFPFLYWCIFALTGSLTDFYPYFFMNIGELGWLKAFMWLAILLNSFIILGFLLLLYDRYIGKKQNLLWNGFCRIFQFIFKFSSRLLPWRKPELIAEENGLQKLPEIIKSKNLTNILIVTDQILFDLGILISLENELNKNNISYAIYKGTSPNPTINNVEEALTIYKENSCQAIIAIGGGSVMDCAKVTGARAVKPKKSVEKMSGLFKIIKRIPPLFCIPTTAGTGSEATLAAVITNSNTHRKFAINDLVLIPRYAVLDPLLTINLPKALTAGTGMDAFTHAIEAFIGRSNTKDTIKNATKAFVLIKDNLLKAYNNGEDITARRNMLMASYFAGLAFTRAYVGNVHAAAHTLSGFYQVPHGLANAVLLPVILEYYGVAVYKKLAKIADIIGIAQEKKTKKEKAEEFIRYLKNLNSEMQIPLKIAGIKDEDLPQMIKNALKEANPLYPVPVIFNKNDFRAVINQIR